MTEACQFCGARLAVGAVACFRCGKMVERGGADGTTGGGALPTQLGTQAKGQLLEGQWRLLKPIGQGSIGVVWQAVDVGLDRPVAVKLMHESLTGDAVAVARFERESRVLAGLEHPHLPPILGIGKQGQQPFLVMKLLEGRSLGELLHARGGRLGVTEAVPVLSQLCEALDYVHGRQVLHRDLKPSNVFIAEGWHVWLLDLGLAHEPGSELTKAGDVLGAVAYLAPEVLHGRRDVDRRSDVFSLGCLAFEAFVGHPPFTGEPRDVLAHQLHTPAPDANALVPSLPAGVGALLQRAMAKLPLERPSTAGDFAHELQRLCGVAADGTVTRGSAAAAPMVMPVRRISRELPRAQPTREASTAPSDPVVPVVPAFDRALDITPPAREAVTAPSDPMVGVVPEVSADSTRIGPRPSRPSAPRPSRPAAPVVDSREGPTGPSARQQRAALRRAALVLGVLAALVIAFIAVTALQPAPALPAAAPLPPEQRPITSVAIVPHDVDVEHAPSSYLLPEGPKAPALKMVEPGKETYKPLDYTRFKHVKPKRVSVRGGALGTAEPALEIKVFGDNHKEVKADVVFDGVRRGLSPVKVNVLPGQHILSVSCSPYPVTDLEITVSQGAKQTIEIELQPPGIEPVAREADVEPSGRGANRLPR